MAELEIGERPSIGVMGGGTGSSTLLSYLKNEADTHAFVATGDDGGSTGRLRREFEDQGLMPPGDLRQVLEALADDDPGNVARQLFGIRIPEGSGQQEVGGHSLGNIILSSLELLDDGDITTAITMAGALLRIQGHVYPITTDSHDVVLDHLSKITRGESNISEIIIDKNQPEALWLEPGARLHPVAEAALHQVDEVVIAPGNLHSSLLPVLSVDGVRQTLDEISAPIVVVANIMNRRHNPGFHVADYVGRVQERTGRVDVVLYNTQIPSAEMIDQYAGEGEFPVNINHAGFGVLDEDTLVVGADLLSEQPYLRNPQDKTTVVRTAIRHDPREVSRFLVGIANGAIPMSR